MQKEVKSVRNFTEMVGDSPRFLRVLRQVELVATTDANVLLLGESGTGKELIARAIHQRSLRKNSALVKINCGAIAPSLVESELFGHEKGAFTGACSRRIGRFEYANGGTIFLDEIGELSLDIQVKLLRVIQEREIERVGGSTPLKVDVRIIAATHRNLEQMVMDKAFRMDLFYRLNVFPLLIPALRDRRDDIALLCHHILRELNIKLAKNIDGLSPNAMNQLVNYDWPGNIRELLNVLERAAIISNDRVIELAEPLDETLRLVTSPLKIITLKQAERRHILSVLNHVGWVISGARGAAYLLDLPASTLRSKMNKLGIIKPSVNSH